MHKQLAKKFIQNSIENEELYIKGILFNDKNSLDLLNTKFNDYIFKIYFASYVKKSIKLKSMEIKNRKKRLSSREELSLNVADSDLKEERLCNISDKPIDFIEEVSLSKNRLDFTDIFTDIKLALIVNGLTVRQREIIYLKYIEQLEEKDIAKILNISPKVVNKVKNSAIRNIRKEIGRVRSGTLQRSS